jgi:hypothetical protein
MKTVYLLKNSPKSFRILLKLVKMGDITTNIIIVDKFYSKILRKDKRVKEFPFIINTLPTAKGLIPKIAKVLPFRMYIQIMNIHMQRPNRNYSEYNHNNNPNHNHNNKYKYNKVGRIITYNHPLKFNNPKITSKKFSIPRFNYKKPVIKAIKQKDKSVNIILYNK